LEENWVDFVVEDLVDESGKSKSNSSIAMVSPGGNDKRIRAVAHSKKFRGSIFL